MAGNLAMRYVLKKRRPNPSGTAGIGTPTRLVTGTVVQLAGSGLGLTSAPSPPVGLIFMPYTEQYLITTHKPEVRRPLKTTSRIRKNSKFVPTNIFETLAAKGQNLSQQLVIREKIKHLEPVAAAPLRLTGREGSPSAPSKRYFELDLDRFQLD